MKEKTAAEFRPFRAWRYNPEEAEIGQVIAPPYDVISGAEQGALYERSPHNCIRLILNRKEDSDNESNNGCTRARDFFTDWRARNILIQEKAESFYFYRQVFRDPESGAQKTRTALLGCLKIEPFEKGVVVPHEKTLSRPREDRRRLIEAARTNFSPIFGLYEDSERLLDSWSAGLLENPPLYDAKDNGVRHCLWIIQDEGVIQKIQSGLRERKIYIADGHHRYQTALEYAQCLRRREEIPEHREIPADFVLTALVGFEDAGLVLLPTHRIVLPFDGFEPERAVEALRPYFDVEPMDPGQLSDRLRRQKGLGGHPKLGLLLEGKRGFLLTLKDFSQAVRRIGGSKPPIWYRLDVNLLNYLILEKLWNLPESEWESKIRYTHSTTEALGCAQGDAAGAVFLMRHPEVGILREMGRVGELLPQKSTYFCPKLASGLVFYHHEQGGCHGD